MHTIPELEHHCGSWIAVNRATGQAVVDYLAITACWIGIFGLVYVGLVLA